MSVYVDPLSKFSTHNTSQPVQGQATCQMYADTLEELHAMADRLGLPRSWFQNEQPEFPHYDLVHVRRDYAISLGAIETDRRHVAEFLRARRKATAA